MEKITDEVKITFRHKLSELIRLRGISKQELCRKVGITYNALFYYETGKRFPKTDVLFNLASALNVSVEELLGKSITLPTSDYMRPPRSYNQNYLTNGKSALISDNCEMKEEILALSPYERKAAALSAQDIATTVSFAKKALTKTLARSFYNELYNLIIYDKKNTQNITITLPNGQTETLNNDDYLNFILLKLQKALLEFKDNYDAQMKDISFDKIP